MFPDLLHRLTRRRLLSQQLGDPLADTQSSDVPLDIVGRLQLQQAFCYLEVCSPAVLLDQLVGDGPKLPIAEHPYATVISCEGNGCASSHALAYGSVSQRS